MVESYEMSGHKNRVDVFSQQMVEHREKFRTKFE